MKAEFMTPVVTIFDRDGGVDAAGCRKVYERLIAGGVDGLVVMGSTGEFFAMTVEQQKQVIDVAAEYKDRVRVLIGVSRMVIGEVAELADYARAKGLDEVMVVSPYYFKFTEEALEAYYDQVADAVQSDVLLYNFPDRTAHDLTPGLVLRLAKKHRNIVGIKDTVTEMGHTAAILRTVLPERPDFQVYSGFDDNLVHNVMSGGRGCIGGLSNLMPERCAAWARAVTDGDVEGMVQGQRFINDAMALYDIGMPFIPTVKRAMRIAGVDVSETCTAPMLPLNDAQDKALRALMKKLGVL